ncbi:biopolymer transporter ExbB [Jannaschia sp. LMIT008]|uniref:biopolymer transporter ExbB n=1 Tax=Jannaschia maritima TaxID=3032585 RepID=UPI0028126082|nr:biopolymer transporter ExbB [Jannaschia sp. LMIT008]
MARSDIKPGTEFSRPIRQIVWMVVVLTAVGAGCYLAYPRVAPIFTANPWLNGTIVGVFVLGVLACFAQVFQLFSAVTWIERFADRKDEATRPPGLLAPLATLLGTRTKRSVISSTAARSILDSVAQRMDEARDITRYIVNTLIFLGLLGTFWGLATTVPAVVDTIRSLNPQGDESSTAVFGRLIGGLESQLAGMGTAFASSLLGLAGSLVVGVLELFAGHGQNRFYRQMEDWMSSITRVGLVGDGETIDQYSLAAVLDHMNHQMEQLQDMFQRAEEGRAADDGRFAALSDAVAAVTRAGDTSGITEQLARVAEGQGHIVDVLRSSAGGGDGGLDAESRMRLRSIDVQLLQVFEEMKTSRSDMVEDLRADLAALTRAIRQMNRGEARAQDRGLPGV